jgi:hypothetical protein
VGEVITSSPSDLGIALGIVLGWYAGCGLDSYRENRKQKRRLREVDEFVRQLKEQRANWAVNEELIHHAMDINDDVFKKWETEQNENHQA